MNVYWPYHSNLHNDASKREMFCAILSGYTINIASSRVTRLVNVKHIHNECIVFLLIIIGAV